MSPLIGEKSRHQHFYFQGRSSAEIHKSEKLFIIVFDRCLSLEDTSGVSAFHLVQLS